jgi:hypothetical protein
MDLLGLVSMSWTIMTVKNEQEDGLKNQDSLCDIFLCELVAAYLHFFVLSLKHSHNIDEHKEASKKCPR